MKINIKGIIEEDWINYKKPCMTIMMPYCNFKCDKECGEPVCQNSNLASAPLISISMSTIIINYLNNDITQAICFQGLEPFDSYEEIIHFISQLRYRYGCNDDIVIYTGYTEQEMIDMGHDPNKLGYSNIIIKFGRFKPNHQPHFDNVLGVNLASDNQYAKKIS